MKQIKKILIAIVLLMIAFITVSCSEETVDPVEEYAYPTVTPQITNGSLSLVNYGGQNVTKESAYVSLKHQYGLSVIENWLAKQTIKTDDEFETAFTSYLEAKRSEEEFEEDCKELNLFTEEAIEKYYRDLFLKTQYHKQMIGKEVENLETLEKAFKLVKLNQFVSEDVQLQTKVTDSDSREFELTWETESPYLSINDEGKMQVTRGQYDNDAELVVTITRENVQLVGTITITIPAKGAALPEENPELHPEFDGYFTEEELKEYYNDNYFDEVKALVFTFQSYSEALSVLEKASGKKVVGEEFLQGIDNAEEVESLFVDIYNELNPNKEIKTIDEAKNIKTLSHEDWAMFNSSVCSTIYNLKPITESPAESYTVLPQFFGTKAYLVLVLEITDPKEEFEEVKGDCYDELFEEVLDTDYEIDVMHAIYEGGKIEIFDEGLENKFESHLLSSYSDDAEFKYERTTGTSNSVVVRYTLTDGSVKELKADELFTEMFERYGAKFVADSLFNMYVLESSSIINPVTHAVLEDTQETLDDEDAETNQEKYDAFYKDEITAIKDALTGGSYVDSGFETTYGFENYLKDELGYASEWELLTSPESGLYGEALENFKKKAPEALGKKYLDRATELFNEYFNVTSTSLYAYVEEDGDMVADKPFGDYEVDEEDVFGFINNFDEYCAEKGFVDEYKGISLEILKKEVKKYRRANEGSLELLHFANILMEACNPTSEGEIQELDMDLFSSVSEEIKNGIKRLFEEMKKFETYELRLKFLVDSYVNSSMYDVVFGPYKQGHIVLGYSTAVAYSNTSSISEGMKLTLESLYKEISDDNKVAYEKGYKIFGNNLENSHFTYGGKFYNCKFYHEGDSYYDNKRFQITYVTTATSKTLYRNTEEKTLEVLTDENYQKYVDGKTLLSSVKSVITAYYVPAVNEIQDEFIENKAAMFEAINEKYGITAELNHDSFNLLDEFHKYLAE